jgi:hypothetical protein
MASTSHGAGTGKSLFERSIETVATAVGDGIGWLAEHGILFGLFGLLWLAVGAGLAFNPGVVSEAWATAGAWPLPLQVVVWLLFLPVMAGLWIWHTDWDFLARVLFVATLAGWTLVMLWPRRADTATREE